MALLLGLGNVRGAHVAQDHAWWSVLSLSLSLSMLFFWMGGVSGDCGETNRCRTRAQRTHAPMPALAAEPTPEPESSTATQSIGWQPSACHRVVVVDVVELTDKKKGIG